MSLLSFVQMLTFVHQHPLSLFSESKTALPGSHESGRASRESREEGQLRSRVESIRPGDRSKIMPGQDSLHRRGTSPGLSINVSVYEEDGGLPLLL